MLWLYTLVLGLGLAVLSPVLWLRNGRHGRYTRHWRERLGKVPPLEREGAIWVHAVSVGEALAVERLVAELQRAFPDRPIVLSVTTAAARQLVEGRIAADRIFYFPLDFRFSTQRTLQAIRPALVLIAETEIWPRFLQQARNSGVRVVFVNGRISGRSYARYRWVRRWLRPVLAGVDRWLMQSATDCERVRDLGAPEAAVEVAGNLKFDLTPPEHRPVLRQLARHFQAAQVRNVIVAGSTMPGEEEILLAVFRHLRQQFPTCILVLAPRHPQRFDAVARQLELSGLPWSRRSQLESAGVHAGGVWLLDSLGELATLYRYADAAFIGGSLAPHGGHNLLEPAYFGVPVVFGPSMHNFAAIAEEFLAAKAAFRAESSVELERILFRLLSDDRLRTSTGEAARALLQAKAGATQRVVATVQAMLGPSFSSASDAAVTARPPA